MEKSGQTRKAKDEKNRKRWDEYRMETQLMRAGEDPYPFTENSLRVPIFATKSYTYSTLEEMLNDPYYYARTENPTQYALDKKLAVLHRAPAAITVASGMAAVHLAASCVLQQRFERVSPKKVLKTMPQKHPEDVPNIVIHSNQYTGSYRLFTKIYPQMGIEPRRVDLQDLQAADAAVDERTKFIFIETPANPNVDILDIKALAGIAHSAGAKCIVDNTFASPVLQRPIELGADFVVESLTKYINGHGDCMGGAVLGAENDILNIRYFWNETQGAVISPFNAWLILRGVKTLKLRMQRHCENAQYLAKVLEKHPKIKEVAYPGLDSHPGHHIAKQQMDDFGGMIAFELDTPENALKFADRMKLIRLGVSLGDTTSLIEFTPYMTGIDLSPKERKSMRISDTHFRFSVGLEDPEDLEHDLLQALDF